MLYKAGIGRIKDDCIIYENGTYYMYSMYWKENSSIENNIWLATSKDGAHFQDYGCVVENFPKRIFAMKPYRTADCYYINSGSFTDDEQQIVLKFWRSTDLYHWEYVPEMDIVSPPAEVGTTRLDCMCIVHRDDKFYGYATGQYGFLTSDDGVHWDLHPTNINYGPFPEYNPALGGFELGDAIYFEGAYYLLCGGFGHLGTNGYGVWVYSSDKPEGPFAPVFPNYQLNGTSRRWVNMWARCFEKDGKTLVHNYLYSGHSYEQGEVYLSLIKELAVNKYGLYMKWWQGNNLLYGSEKDHKEQLAAEGTHEDIFSLAKPACHLSENCVELPPQAIVDITLRLEENEFTKYSAGGFYLAETESTGTAIIFDTYGKCEIVFVKDGQIQFVDDSITFPRCALYHLAAGREYNIRLLVQNGLFEIYVDDIYLQTFNNAHFAGSVAKPFTAIRAMACRKQCILSNIKIYEMNA